MAKDKEPPELPLPPDFFAGDGANKGSDNVTPFGKRPKRLRGLIPDEPPLTPAVPKILSYRLSDEELIDLRSFLNSRPRLEQLKKEESPTDDSPLAMLKDLVHQIEVGHIKPVAAFVATVEFAPDGTEHYPFYVTQLPRLAVIGMLHELLEDLP